jgi:DNA (cytosine-5)-methyltransferase 1
MTNLGSYPIQIHYTSEKYRKKFADYFEKQFEQAKKQPIYTVRTSNIIDTVTTSGSGWINQERLNGRNPPAVRNFFFGDVREASGDWILKKLGLSVGELDLIAGGPPCQGFSHSGKRNVMDPRNSLVFEYARIICEMRPKTMVMENVPGIGTMVTAEGIPVLDAFCQILEDGGFGTIDALRRGLLSSSGCGGTVLRRKKNGKSEEEQEDPRIDATVRKVNSQLSMFQ